MKIHSARFVLLHKKRVFMVDMKVQDTDSNRRRAIVSVEDCASGKTILNQSMSGRQLICQETAKQAIKTALKEQANGREKS